MSSEDDWEFIDSVTDVADDGAIACEGSHDATCIVADLLIPGKGRPKHDQAVIADRGKVVYVGSPHSVPKEYKSCKAVSVPVLMPGLWECHSHFVGASPLKPIDVPNLAMGDTATAGARAVRALRDTLYAGYTSCVDLGGFGPELQTAMDEGVLLGPTIYGAGGALSQTAGHADVFEYPLGAAWQKLRIGSSSSAADPGTTAFIICDGVDEVRRAVRVNLRRGAKVIKIMASGGVTSLSDDPAYQQFSDVELRTIVEEAARFDIACAAHAVGKAGIMAAIRAGVRTIEHGSYLDDEAIVEMKERGVMLVATITPLQSALDNRDAYPPEMYRKIAALAESHKAAYARAVKAGVVCATGSDLFGGSGSVLGAGQNGKEVGYAVRAGMTPLQAVEAATANGPLTLGPRAPKSGQIRVGYDADFISLDEDPLGDIDLLAEPRSIKRIWKGGKLVKAPGLDYWDVVGGV